MQTPAATPGSVMSELAIATLPLITYVYSLLKDSRPKSREDAHTAWRRRYPTPSVELSPNDSPPFVPGHRLGEGGFGQVHEVKLGGTVVALKRTWIPRGRFRPCHVSEIKLLQQMSLNRHQHIIEIIGSYVLPKKNETEIGMLLWPVAQYDLSRLLSHIELLHRVWIHGSEDATDEAKDALLELRLLTGLHILDANISEVVRHDAAVETYNKARLRVLSAIGCIAKAIRYLHNDQMIRHKDLKPSQVLLSTSGLWLTDFGWSVDISDADRTDTCNGERITFKYHAPERAEMKPCGRAEDIFGLGCIFLEIAIIASGRSRDAVLQPGTQQGWSYEAELGKKEDWLNGLKEAPCSEDATPLTPLLWGMLEREPEYRPTIAEVLQALKRAQRFHHFGALSISYFAECCTSAEST